MNFKFVKSWILANLFKISMLFIVIGYVLMSVGTSKTGDTNSFVQLTISPVFLFVGYTLIIFAIMNRSKN